MFDGSGEWWWRWWGEGGEYLYKQFYLKAAMFVTIVCVCMYVYTSTEAWLYEWTEWCLFIDMNVSIFGFM